MQKIANNNGQPLDGMYRTTVGAIVVDNQDGMQKYLRERNTEKRLRKLESEVETLRATINKLIGKE